MHVYVSVFMFAFVCVCVCVHLCRGKGRIGGPAGTTLVNNGSFILPEHLTGLCVATATHTDTEPERKHTHRRLHTFIRKILGGIHWGSVFTYTRHVCVCVSAFFFFLCVLVCVCC